MRRLGKCGWGGPSRRLNAVLPSADNAEKRRLQSAQSGVGEARRNTANMKITPKQYAQLLYEMTKDAEKGALIKAVHSFIALLERNRALSIMPRIERSYCDVYNVQEEVVDAQVVSARELSSHNVKELKSVFKDYNVECKSYVDPGVLGGARIQVGDYMIDDTLKARLQELKRKMIQ